MTHPFIVFEGVDGAGKSTISKHVADSLGASHLESPINEFKKIRKFVEDNLCEKGKLFYYLASNFELSSYIRTNRLIKPIVCARYFHSTMIGHASRQYLNIEEFSKKLPVSSNEFEAPDLTIFLSLSEDAQRARINARGASENSEKDHKCLDDKLYRDYLFQNYSNVAQRENWLIIDTTLMTVENVVDICIKRILSL
jgi:dTMP kinase